MELERRFGGAFRVDEHGRTVTGAVVKYGDVAVVRGQPERIVPGAFGDIGTVDVNLQHDPDIVLARNAVLTDGPRELRARATLPIGSAGIALIKRSAINGYSLEMRVTGQRFEAGARIIERAELHGLALVDSPAYPQSRIELRQRQRLTTVRGHVPTDRRLACECRGPDCTHALFSEGAFHAGDRGREVLAVWQQFNQPLASRRRGSVRFWERDGNLEFAVDVDRESDAGRALLEAMDSETLPTPIARPYLDRASTGTKSGATMEYGPGDAIVRALILSPTDKDSGWPALRRKRGDDDDVPATDDTVVERSEQRARYWL